VACHSPGLGWGFQKPVFLSIPQRHMVGLKVVPRRPGTPAALTGSGRLLNRSSTFSAQSRD
jgi:hypothetical protein